MKTERLKPVRQHRWRRRFSRHEVATCRGCGVLKAIHPPKGFTCEGVLASDERGITWMRQQSFRLQRGPKQLQWWRARETTGMTWAWKPRLW